MFHSLNKYHCADNLKNCADIDFLQSTLPHVTCGKGHLILVLFKSLVWFVRHWHLQNVPIFDKLSFRIFTFITLSTKKKHENFT